MNSATSVSPTSSLEINNLFNDKVTLADYPVQAGRSSANDLTRNNSGYRRLTLREKVAKQRSERDNELAKATAKSSVDGSADEPRVNRLTKTTSLGGASISLTNHRKPTVRSQSNDAITEEGTVFGFKVMKGLRNRSDAANNNTSSGFTRQGSSRQPVKTAHHSTTGRFRNKSGGTLFYAPKSARDSESTYKSEVVKPEGNESEKGSLNSVGGNTRVGTTSLSSRHLEKKSVDTVEKVDKDSSDRDNTSVEGGLNTHTEGIRNIGLKERRRTSNKSDSSDTKTDTKNDGHEIAHSEVFGVNKEDEVKRQRGKKAENLLIRAESLREGKSRLEEFREKQRRGNLTRSLTNPDFEQSESTLSNKGKNISESLAEIRERIRERRRKKEMLKKSRSLPETDLPPKEACEENTTEILDNATDNGTSKEVKQSKKITRSEENMKEFSGDGKDNTRKHEEIELNRKAKSTEESRGGNGSSLNEMEYLEIEENTKMNNNKGEENVAATDTRCEDVITTDSREVIEETKDRKETVKDTADDEVVVKDTSDNEVVVKDTRNQVDLKTIDKKDSAAKEIHKEISKDKKIELKEILSNEKMESQETTSLSKQEESTDAKTGFETSLSNDTNAVVATSEQADVKKPTKRERRKRERYQRSKTMSAIMYNEISLDARREMQHKGTETNGESVGISSVSEIKKRFLEAESGSAKMSELGLFYSGKTTAKSSGVDKPTSRGNTTEKDSSKDDSVTNTAKSRTRKYVSRRHTLAPGNNVQGNVAQEKDGKTTLAKSVDVSTCITDKTKSTEPKHQTKIPLCRSHTLPSSNSSDFSEDKRKLLDDDRSSEQSTRKEVQESGGRLPVRRHTFCSQTSLMISRHSPIKLSESVEALREKFSKGGAPVFNLATSSSKASSTKTNRNDADSDETNRRRVKSDSSVQSKLTAEEAKDVSRDTTNRSSLVRRHTIANRPALVRQNSEKDSQERQEFFEKFLAKDDEIRHESDGKSEGKKLTKDDTQSSRHSKKDKDEKLYVSRLKKLFLGQPSTEKKTKLRDRRAKTIAGGISPEMMKELGINTGTNVIANKYVVQPDHYVSGEAKEEREFEDRPERRRRSSDLNPDSFLSPISLSPEETVKDSVFGEEKPSHDEVSSDVILPTTPADPARRESGSKPDLKISGCVEDEKSSQDEVQSNGSSEFVNLKTPTESSFPGLNPALRQRSGSDSDMNKAIKDQCLDEYLTTIKTIKTLVESPNAQRRTSPRGSPEKGKFVASQSFDENEAETTKPRRHLSAVKHLSMHSWSTSDLDKIIHGGDGASPSASQVDISSMNFDEISSSTTRLQSLTEGRTKARPKRTSSKTLNPMKSLMERTDVRTHTEEPEEENKSTSGFEKPKKRSNPRKKRSQLEPWRRHTLDPVAIAALASREDFSRVSLRKTKGPGKDKEEYDGSLPVMLIQVKGRRQVQTRLVEPSLSSLNTGDCFILVTPKELFCWIGQHANAIEKAKAVEISSKIQKRGDLNCKTGDVLYIDETKQGNTLAYRKFCKILEGDTTFPIEDANLCPDDEFYEREVISTNNVYKLQEGEPPHLIPVTELCGYMPRIGILNTKEVFVFDFGSELYLWTGQQSLSGKRKVAFHLAEMLYKQQFDCEGVVSPIEPRRPLKRSQSSKHVYRDADGKERGRPTWTLFAKLHEKAETLLFQEKFFDWPDPTKIIKMKGHVSSGEIQERPPPVELKPCDPTEMQKPASDLEPVILEATNLGRGLGTPNVEVNGEVKEGDLVTTLGMTVWLVTQNKHFVLPKPSEGHFHSGDGYVIRWVYFVAKNRIVRNKRGRIRPLTGRQRCAYFFWQGNECSVNEKGAAAIMAVDLDEEHGPQIRVVEGKEPPHFLKLFDGAMMVIHSGKRIRVSEEQDEFSDKSTVRMYCIRNDDISEGCLVQVKRSASSLRSRSSFVVVDSEAGNIFVWHGCKANEYHRKSAEKAANFIKERRPLEMNLSEEISTTLIEVEEGQESDVFWTTVSGKKNSYLSLLKDPLNYNFSPRLFHMSSATGQFISTEILCPSRYPGRTCPFPVLQDDLYSASQPAAFLLDVGDEAYVWEGWMPAEITKDKRGSAKRRWDEERKLTLQTTMSYVKEANGRIMKGAYVVQAGLEPVSFTTHFPFWNRRQSITEINTMEGKKDCEKKSVEDAFDNFTQKFYSFQELTSDNPPDGVDPSNLEMYLTDDEFHLIFEMSRDLFGQLPGWKQDVLKKAFGLF